MIIQRLLLPARVGTIELAPGGMVDLNSYFNAVDLTFWRRVVEAGAIGLQIRHRGDLKVTVTCRSRSREKPSALERTLLNTKEETTCLDSVLADAPSGQSSDIVSLRLSSETGATVQAVDWYTQTHPTDAVRVGIIITHFNRQEWVLPAVERIRKELLDDEELNTAVRLVIVDNSRNLRVADSERIKVLPSPNFGGSGGFSKGLLHLKEVGGFTHAIFMDDDATCEMESIKRVIRFFQLNRNNRVAVSGALFCDPSLDRLHEAGASWTDTWQPRCGGLKPAGNGLLELVGASVKATYGGWWLFAFSLKDQISWPFPFFIRGDDVCFSLANGYEIVSPLGVACRAENFDGKDNIFLKYLEARMHSMPPLVFGTCGLIPLLRRLNTICFCCLESYRYAAADIFLHGVEDCLGSEAYWLENIDSRAFRERYAGLFAEESYGQQGTEADLVKRPRFEENAPRKVLRYLTLGGHLLPKCILPKGRVVTEKSWSVANHDIFPFRRIRIHDALTGKSWDTERDLPRLLRILWKLLIVDVKVARAYLFHRDRYRRIYDNLSTRKSWEKIFSAAVGEKETLPA
jgi:galactofuranosylgalactofuranosylrhamnosyl-N-acetylglucosaminyl-diphospho-decaprenol beta-1,5/1,6-galactofuranosyltransferase